MVDSGANMVEISIIELMSRLMKLITFVPLSHGEIVRKAMGDAGAGVLGNYSYCTFTLRGIGRFKPEAGANPTLGEVGKFEEVEEERIETLCEFDKVKDVILAIKKVHPYEEVPIDVYPIEVIE